MTTQSLILSADEIQSLTGYKQSTAQLKALLRMGFYRARLSRIGGVILEREHYQAVCQGAYVAAANAEAYRPKVRI
jgi:hypothetical protein